MSFTIYSGLFFLLDSPDDWEYFLHYLGCLLDDGSSLCMGNGSNLYPPKHVGCKNKDLPDEVVCTYGSCMQSIYCY